MNKLLLLSVCLIAIWLFSACAEDSALSGVKYEFTEPPSDREPSQEALYVIATDEYPIACYFFDPSKKDYGQGLPLFNQAWVWAQSGKYGKVIAEGPRQDGFVVAESIRGWDPLLGMAKEEAASNPDQLEDLCQKSIEKAHPNKKLKLYRIAAFKSLVDRTRYPVVVGEKSSPNKITRMVIFGDSLSDTGRLKDYLQVFPERPYFLGRFSNGPNWADILTDFANVAVRNYSKGGAVSAPNVNFSAKEIISSVRDFGRNLVTGSVSKFIDDYLKDQTRNGKIGDSAHTIFAIWVGANDYIARFDSVKDLTDMLDKPDLDKRGGKYIAKFSVENIANAVKKLYQAGARNFLVGNLPDFGLTPVMAINKNYRRNDTRLPENLQKYLFSSKISALIKIHNAALAQKLEQLRSELPGANIVLLDAYKALNDLVNGVGPHGEQNFDYGINIPASFTTVSASGQKPLLIGQKCYLGKYLFGTRDERKICDNANEVLFWDDVHPTSIAHCGLAFLIHTTLYDSQVVNVKPDFNEYEKLCKP